MNGRRETFGRIRGIGKEGREVREKRGAGGQEKSLPFDSSVCESGRDRVSVPIVSLFRCSCPSVRSATNPSDPILIITCVLVLQQFADS